MVNGKTGDHPLTDIILHRVAVFTPEIDNLVFRISKLMPRKELDELIDWFAPPPTDKFEQILRERYESLTKEAKERGWEVEE